jgi:hypothetical protein
VERPRRGRRANHERRARDSARFQRDGKKQAQCAFADHEYRLPSMLLDEVRRQRAAEYAAKGKGGVHAAHERGAASRRRVLGNEGNDIGERATQPDAGKTADDKQRYKIPAERRQQREDAEHRGGPDDGRASAVAVGEHAE